MKPISFDIELDKGDSTYEPGEEVTGRVLVNLKKPDAVRGIKIKVTGDCNVRWTRQTFNREGGSVMMTEKSKGHENYIKFTKYIIGSAHNSNVKLIAGEQSYPFSFPLPHQIPSSFEYKYGHVRYTIKAVIDRPWKFDYETIKQLPVVSRFDLNTETAAAEEIYDEDALRFCCFWFFKVADMDVRITLPMSGYVPGQNIDAKIFFDNRSDVSIRKIKLLLQQDMKFHENTHTKEKMAKTIVQQETLKGPFDKTDQVTISILVPQLPPSSLECCTLIDVEYNLKIKLAVSGLHCDIEKTYPILIGTVPLNSVASHAPTASILPDVEVTTVPDQAKPDEQPSPKDVELGLQNDQSGTTKPPERLVITEIPSRV